MSYIFQIGAISFLLGVLATLICCFMMGVIASTIWKRCFEKSIVFSYHEELRKIMFEERKIHRDLNEQRYKIDDLIKIKEYYPNDVFLKMLNAEQQKFNEIKQLEEEKKQQISNFEIPDNVLIHYNKYYKYSPATSWEITEWAQYY